MNLGTCTFTNYDTGTNTLTGLDCPYSAPTPKYTEFTGSGQFVRLGIQNNDGTYLIDQDFYNTLLLLFWGIPIAFSIVWYLSIRAYRLGKKI